jgi:hypothetical protein
MMQISCHDLVSQKAGQVGIPYKPGDRGPDDPDGRLASHVGDEQRGSFGSPPRSAISGEKLVSSVQSR